MAHDPTAVAKTALQRATKAGAKQAEVFIGRNRELTVNVRDGRADSVKQADGSGLGLRVFVDGRAALVYTTDFRPDALASLAERAVALAKQAPADPANQIAPDAIAKLPSLELHDPAVASLTPDRAIAMAVAAEKAARAVDPRIQATQFGGASCGDSRLVVANSNGLERSYAQTNVGLFIGVLAADSGGKQRTGNDGSQRRFLADLKSPEAIGQEAGRRAVRMIGAKPVATQKLPVVMHADIAASWLANMSGAFSGEQVFKKASWLADKLGQTVASPLVSIVDDPHRSRASGAKPFDAEGVPTRRAVLLEKGVVKQFVYDLRWASKAGAASTGHATRGYTSSPSIGFHCLFIENGTTPVEEMIRGIDHGFYLTTTGAFGYDPATGGWSYASQGLMIEKGQLGQPVADVSLASDSLTMLMGVEAVGNDLEFDGGVNAPHLKIKQMALSGT
jgi:PmbA protein